MRVMKSSFTEEKGSTTIEAALIVSALLIILMALIFSFTLMYQKVYLRSCAAEIAEEAAQLWVEDNSLYYRIYEDSYLFGDKEFYLTGTGNLSLEDTDPQGGNFYERKFARINGLIIENLKKTLRNPEKTSITINYHNNLLSRSITITLKQEMAIPFGGLRRFFGGQENFTISESSKAVVTDPTEYIRNIDLALEYATRVKSKIKLGDIIKKLGKK